MRRPLWKPVKDRNPVTVAVVALLLMAVIGGLAYRADDLPVVGGGTTYTASFSEAAGLRSGSEVRVAGVKVGKVTGVELDGAKVKVTFRVKDTWIGDASTLTIAIKTLLGDKFIAVDPLGVRPQATGKRIPLDRTTSPYDVTEAFDDLSRTVTKLDTAKYAQALDAMSETFAGTPPEVRKALDGMAALSKTISSRDDELAKLLAGTREISGTFADQSDQVQRLLRDGNLLLAELKRRRDAIHSMLVGSRALSKQLTGLVNDNEKTLEPAMKALGRVTTLLERNRDSLNKALKMAGPYTRLVGNALGSGRWMDGYICGLIPAEYLPEGAGPKEGCMPPKRGGN